MRNLLLLTASLLLATPALADGQATAQPASLVQPAGAKPKLYCRFMTHEGMLLRPICKTKAQWDVAAYQARKQLADFQNHNYVSP